MRKLADLVHLYTDKKNSRMGSLERPAVKIKCTNQWLEYEKGAGAFGYRYGQPCPHRTVPWEVTCIDCLEIELKKHQEIVDKIESRLKLLTDSG